MFSMRRVRYPLRLYDAKVATYSAHLQIEEHKSTDLFTAGDAGSRGCSI